MERCKGVKNLRMERIGIRGLTICPKDAAGVVELVTTALWNRPSHKGKAMRLRRLCVLHRGRCKCQKPQLDSWGNTGRGGGQHIH